MPSNPDSAMYNAWTRNALDEPQYCRGPSQLPLEPNAWNRAELALGGGTVRVLLNGQPVYERPLDASGNRR